MEEKADRVFRGKEHLSQDSHISAPLIGVHFLPCGLSFEWGERDIRQVLKHHMEAFSGASNSHGRRIKTATKRRQQPDKDEIREFKKKKMWTLRSSKNGQHSYRIWEGGQKITLSSTLWGS